jgi:hypothetical protein
MLECRFWVILDQLGQTAALWWLAEASQATLMTIRPAWQYFE